MTLALLSHPACPRHETGEGHPERPERATSVLAALAEARFDEPLVEVTAPRVAREALLRVHAKAHVDAVDRRAPAEGLIHFDADTPMGPHSHEAALRAAGAAVAAVDLVLGGEHRAAFCCVRPPGHHATPSRAMGFCLFNNVAVAAAHALEAHGLERVAIADFDVHHGNGTEDAFAGDERVLFFSSFQERIYPNPSLGGAANVVKTPIPGGSPPSLYREIVERSWFDRLAAFRPQLLLISAGFDAHRADPLADLRLEAEDFAWVTARLREAAAPSTGDRIVSTLEGGYDLDALGASAAAHVQALCAR